MEDRRVSKTERSLRNAFWEVLESKRIDKITVKDICERAEVSRSTFYDHYESYTTFLNSLSDEVAEKIMACVDLYRFDMDTDALVDALFALMKKEPHLFSLLLSDYFPDAKAKILRITQPDALEVWRRESDLPENELAFLYSYFMNASFWIFGQWMSGKIDVDEERIKELYEEIMKYGIYEYLYTK